MLIRDVMTTKVITVASDTSIYDAQEIMRSNGIERLPIVDEGKLVGVTTKDTILRASPSPTTARSIWEFHLDCAQNDGKRRYEDSGGHC